MAARGSRRRKANGNGGTARDGNADAPRPIVAISVRSGAGFQQQWISSADGDLTEDPAEAHRFLLVDAQELQRELQGSFTDCSIHAIGDESSVDPS